MTHLLVAGRNLKPVPIIRSTIASGHAAMHPQFRIVDEQRLRRRLRIKPMQLAAIFIAGSVFGYSFSSISPGGALAATDLSVPNVHAPPPLLLADEPWCNPRKARLRMSCTLAAGRH
ncbi:MAG: hypothetical protein ACRETM_11760 [Stenotrophobium sp.]